MLVASISDTDRSRFTPLFELKAEDSDERLKREDNLRKARAELTAALPTLLPEEPRAGARSIRILEAVAAASEAFGGKGGRLFVLSDAIEESPTLNLAHLSARPEAIPGAIDKARAAELLPDLKGVKLHIIGAGGDDTAIGVEGIRAFWHAYADATGATLVHIGRMPHEAE